MKRKIIIENDDAVVRLVEDEHEDEVTLTVNEVGMSREASIVLAPDQLWKLAEQILTWFDAKAIRSDEQRAAAAKLRERIDGVLHAHEARCMDDDIDRGVVVRALVLELS